MCQALQEYFKAPGKTQAGLAQRVNVKQASVSRWTTGRVPAERVLAVEAATDGALTRHDLRPDLYPEQPA